MGLDHFNVSLLVSLRAQLVGANNGGDFVQERDKNDYYEMVMMWGESRLGLGRGGGVRPTSCPRAPWAAPGTQNPNASPTRNAMQAQNGKGRVQKVSKYDILPSDPLWL